MTTRDDWTADADGRTNSGERYNEAVRTVFHILESDSLGIASGASGRYAAARLIVAQLAHVHHLAPQDRSEGVES